MPTVLLDSLAASDDVLQATYGGSLPLIGRTSGLWQ
jgi:hypothetical protein